MSVKLDEYSPRLVLDIDGHAPFRDLASELRAAVDRGTQIERQLEGRAGDRVALEAELELCKRRAHDARAALSRAARPPERERERERERARG